MLLVTGITGHSGKYFLEELMKNQYEENIRCIVRENSDLSMFDQRNLKIETVIGDLEDSEFLARTMQGVDTVMHIASIFYFLKVIKTYFVSVPLPVGVGMAYILKGLSFGKIDYVEKVQRMAENRNFSHEKSVSDFGYAPMPLKEGLALEVNDYLNHKKKL